jgi:hypothetical protein
MIVFDSLVELQSSGASLLGGADQLGEEKPFRAVQAEPHVL